MGAYVVTDPIAFDAAQVTHPENRVNPLPGDPAPPLVETGQPRVALRLGVRKLMPVEMERLQGFEDGWTDVDGASDSARARQLGNAVAVPVVEWIARRIKKADE
jgi:site-specific DNA-cytosine methylase